MELSPQSNNQENDELVYQAPDIEEVISLDEINQEVLYAGTPVGSAARNT